MGMGKWVMGESGVVWSDSGGDSVPLEPLPPTRNQRARLVVSLTVARTIQAHGMGAGKRSGCNPCPVANVLLLLCCPGAAFGINQ